MDAEFSREPLVKGHISKKYAIAGKRCTYAYTKRI